MMPIWGRYGPFYLYGYSVVLGLGVVLALGLTAASRRADDAPGWWDGALAAATGALVGGRAVFVWLNGAYFAENLGEAWQLWRGGLSYHGALLGGLLALWLWALLAHRARATGRPWGRYAGLMAPGLALLTAFGWAACWAEGCAYGRAAPPGLWAADLPDDAGVFALRYPAQLLGAAGALGVAALTWVAAGRARPAALFWGALGGLSLVHALVGLLRGDPTPVVGGVRLDVWIDLALVGVSVVGLLVGRRTAVGR
jgi:phosphatidylglycerol:prolipoprotein diacylglycerol transferase